MVIPQAEKCESYRFIFGKAFVGGFEDTFKFVKRQFTDAKHARRNTFTILQAILALMAGQDTPRGISMTFVSYPEEDSQRHLSRLTESLPTVSSRNASSNHCSLRVACNDLHGSNCVTRRHVRCFAHDIEVGKVDQANHREANRR